MTSPAAVLHCLLSASPTGNLIGDDGAVALGQALAVNSSLTAVDLFSVLPHCCGRAGPAPVILVFADYFFWCKESRICGRHLVVVGVFFPTARLHFVFPPQPACSRVPAVSMRRPPPKKTKIDAVVHHLRQRASANSSSPSMHPKQLPLALPSLSWRAICVPSPMVVVFPPVRPQRTPSGTAEARRWQRRCSGTPRSATCACEVWRENVFGYRFVFET